MHRSDRVHVIARVSATMAFATLAGCAPDLKPWQGDSGTTAAQEPVPEVSTSSTQDEDTSLATSADPATTSPGSSDTTTSECGFISCPDLPSPLPEYCDVWEQDCPEGYKCTHVISASGHGWDANRCVPVVDTPKKPGEVCNFLDEFGTGLDDCDAKSVCEFHSDGTGVCLAFCVGSSSNPTCLDGGTTCSINSDGTRVVCEPKCDPIAQDCPDPDRMTCLIGRGFYGFSCELSWGDEGYDLGQECQFDNSCLSGLLCWYDPTALPNCEGDACCTSYCELATNGCLAQPGTQCVPVYDDEDAPPGYSHVGVCLIPE